MTWTDFDKSLHRKTHRAFAMPVELDGTTLMAVVDWDAQSVEDIYDRRVMVEFLKEELEQKGVDPAIGQPIVIDGESYVLEQRNPPRITATGEAVGSTRWVELWLLR